MEETLPRVVVAIAAASAAATSVAVAIRKVAIPMLRGLRELSRASSELVEGARLAREQLAPNGGSSLVDRVEFVWVEVQEARRRVELSDERVDALGRRVEELRADKDAS